MRSVQSQHVFNALGLNEMQDVHYKARNLSDRHYTACSWQCLYMTQSNSARHCVLTLVPKG